MNRKRTETEQELFDRLDEDMALTQFIAGRMPFDSLWEYTDLFSIMKRIHWYLKHEHVFCENEIEALMSMDFPMLTLARYYVDMMDDFDYDELVAYACFAHENGDEPMC